MSEPLYDADLLVVGGGAAGFFAALRAADLAPEKRIVLLEGSGKTLNKVRISGGGRCNLTHACFDPAELVKFYPRGSKELLGPFHKFGPGDTLDWFEARQVEAKTEEDGRMFPITDSSETVAHCLEQEAENLGIQIRLSQRVTAIHRREEGFTLQMASGPSLTAPLVMVASGSQPAMWDIMARLGHEIVPPVPSLFTFKILAPGLSELSGISVPQARVSLPSQDIHTEGPLLITHEGLSGPAVLRLSAWAARAFADLNYRSKIEVNWTGLEEAKMEWQIQKVRAQDSKKNPGSTPLAGLPSRLWLWILGRAGVSANQRWADLTATQMEAIQRECLHCQLSMTGKSTFKEEFVTAGGVELSELDFRRFESRKVPGLFLAGEVINIDAITGGFNFQAAWTGGWLAGTEIGQRMGGGG
ncbi:MAG: NAD(P)/FAD-dependent oxidoreductase [Bacteroidia bacterium]|nr:NAD(P)/FAD-dependent oxidoreductase [Bacteroidia bacterium]